MAAARRAGYDATFSAPKSVSIQAFIGGDARLIAAHETAVTEALRELETFACHQDGRGINKRYVASGQIAAAIFRHGESRALDPHLHSHAFIFNITQDTAGPRLLALESSNIFERARYLTEVYRNALAREVQGLGYAIERREHGFELAGVSSDLLERFSKRAKERDALIATREAELGRELTRDEIAVLVRENRAKKQYELTPVDVRQRQFAQVNGAERRQLDALRKKGMPLAAERVPLTVAIERAVEHVFERKSVVPELEQTAARRWQNLDPRRPRIGALPGRAPECRDRNRLLFGLHAVGCTGTARTGPTCSREIYPWIAGPSGRVSRPGWHGQDSCPRDRHRGHGAKRPGSGLFRPEHAGG
jgi:conjugative relaxase-like TrwC/TraI family protein